MPTSETHSFVHLKLASEMALRIHLSDLWLQGSNWLRALFLNPMPHLCQNHAPHGLRSANDWERLGHKAQAATLWYLVGLKVSKRVLAKLSSAIQDVLTQPSSFPLSFMKDEISMQSDCSPASPRCPRFRLHRCCPWIKILTHIPPGCLLLKGAKITRLSYIL